MTGDPFPQSKLQALLEIGVCDRERQQNSDDDDKRLEIVNEARQVLAADGVEEPAVPIVELDLSKHVGNGDDGRSNEDRHHPSPAFSLPKHAREQAQVPGKIEIVYWRSFDERVRERRSGGRVRHDRQQRICGLRQLRNCLSRRGDGLGSRR